MIEFFLIWKSIQLKMAGGSKKGVGSSDPNGKAAMERVGLFSEVGYISIGKYVDMT